MPVLGPAACVSGERKNTEKKVKTAPATQGFPVHTGGHLPVLPAVGHRCTQDTPVLAPDSPGLWGALHTCTRVGVGQEQKMANAGFCQAPGAGSRGTRGLEISPVDTPGEGQRRRGTELDTARTAAQVEQPRQRPTCSPLPALAQGHRVPGADMTRVKQQEQLSPVQHGYCLIRAVRDGARGTTTCTPLQSAGVSEPPGFQTLDK